MEYRGGTYISQTRASSPKQAVKRWAIQLNPKGIWGFGKTTKKLLALKRQTARARLEISQEIKNLNLKKHL